MTDKQQKANIVCCETCSHREVCYDVITNTDYDFKGYGCLRYCVSPLVISNNARKETAKEIFSRLLSIGSWCTPFDWNDYFEIDMDDFRKLAKQFGVEVEE